ncbi:hypothetical protein [Campylobacter majalis]|uniref:hypothetical protein n=1 Tax=Campylobacter majalis TaxID=2790656 RepID=UPI003D68BDD8
MAFYNPQKIAFNPNTGLIQATGAVGTTLWDMYNKNLQNEQNQATIDETKRHHESVEKHQADALAQSNKHFNENLAFGKDKFNAEQAWKQKTFNFDIDKFNAEQDFRAKQHADNMFYKNLALQDRIDARNEKIAEQNANAYQDLEGINIPAYNDSVGTLQAVISRVKDMSNNGKQTYANNQGFFQGGAENFKGFFGYGNNNQNGDDVLAILSQDMYNKKHRRDTKYNKEFHDSIYRLPSAGKFESVNQKNAALIVNDYTSTTKADINEKYNKLLAKPSVLKNPQLAKQIQSAKDAELKEFDELVKPISDYFGNKTQDPLWQDAKADTNTSIGIKVVPNNTTNINIDAQGRPSLDEFWGI